MKKILFVLVALCAVFSACTVTPKEVKTEAPKGDLAFFDLTGQVKSVLITRWTEEYLINFDQEGKIDFPEAEIEEEIDEETGEKFIAYNYHDGGWDNWSIAKPYTRVYDAQGRLICRGVGYEDINRPSYNADGTVSKEEWWEESMHGTIDYTYDASVGPNRRIKQVECTGEEGTEEEDLYTENYVAFKFDTHGNWISRFVVGKTDGDVYSARVETRTITYYDEAPEGLWKDSNNFVFKGFIGEEEAGIGIVVSEYYNNGYFYLKRNESIIVRKITDLEYNKENGALTFTALYMDGSELGKFVGDCDGYNLKGTFTNTKGRTVEFHLSDPVQ